MKLIELCDVVIDCDENVYGIKMESCRTLARACKLMYEELKYMQSESCGECAHCNSNGIIETVGKLMEEK